MIIKKLYNNIIYIIIKIYNIIIIIIIIVVKRKEVKLLFILNIVKNYIKYKILFITM